MIRLWGVDKMLKVMMEVPQKYFDGVDVIAMLNNGGSSQTYLNLGYELRCKYP